MINGGSRSTARSSRASAGALDHLTQLISHLAACPLTGQRGRKHLQTATDLHQLDHVILGAVGHRGSLELLDDDEALALQLLESLPYGHPGHAEPGGENVLLEAVPDGELAVDDVGAQGLNDGRGQGLHGANGNSQ